MLAPVSTFWDRSRCMLRALRHSSCKQSDDTVTVNTSTHPPTHTHTETNKHTHTQTHTQTHRHTHTHRRARARTLREHTGGLRRGSQGFQPRSNKERHACELAFDCGLVRSFRNRVLRRTADSLGKLTVGSIISSSTHCTQQPRGSCETALLPS